MTFNVFFLTFQIQDRINYMCPILPNGNIAFDDSRTISENDFEYTTEENVKLNEERGSDRYAFQMAQRTCPHFTSLMNEFRVTPPSHLLSSAQCSSRNNINDVTELFQNTENINENKKNSNQDIKTQHDYTEEEKTENQRFVSFSLSNQCQHSLQSNESSQRREIINQVRTEQSKQNNFNIMKEKKD